MSQTRQVELGGHHGEIHVERYDDGASFDCFDLVVHEPHASRSVDTVGSMDEARAWAKYVLRYPEQPTPIMAVTIHEPAGPGETIGAVLEIHARNKVAADLAAQRARSLYFGGRSPDEVLFESAGLEALPRLGRTDRAGPVGRTGPFAGGDTTANDN